MRVPKQISFKVAVIHRCHDRAADITADERTCTAYGQAFKGLSCRAYAG